MSQSSEPDSIDVVCSECGSDDDVETCKECGEPHCSSCFQTCDGCQEPLCPDGDQVQIDVGIAMATQSFTVCRECQKEDQWQPCAYCDEPIGDNGFEECSVCGAKVCPCCDGDSEFASISTEPLTRCSKCNSFVCRDCLPKDADPADVSCRKCEIASTA